MGRTASGSVEFPFWRREAIARRFGTASALLEAERAFETGRAAALDWDGTQAWEVLADLYRLYAIAQLESVAAAAMVDVDWSAIEALMRIVDAPPPSP